MQLYNTTTALWRNGTMGSSAAASTTTLTFFTPLVSATWFDETLVSARKVNKLVVVRFGRSSDRLCQRCDVMLQQAVDVPEMASVLSLYTVDVDAVPEFSYMYELYDPFAIMLFHQSKPIVVDAGHGPVRKLTEINSAAWLRAMLLRAIRTTLDVRLEVSMAEAQSRGSGSNGATDAPDAPASLKEEVARIAQGASEWLGAKSDVISHRVGAAMEQSGGWIQSVEERGWSVLQKASTSGLAALESARQSLGAVQRATGPAHFFGAPPAAAAAGGKPADARASDSTRASSPTAAAAAQQAVEPPASESPATGRIAVPVPAAEPEERNVHGERV